jgi:hypothetical protein
LTDVISRLADDVTAAIQTSSMGSFRRTGEKPTDPDAWLTGSDKLR